MLAAARNAGAEIVRDPHRTTAEFRHSIVHVRRIVEVLVGRRRYDDIMTAPNPVTNHIKAPVYADLEQLLVRTILDWSPARVIVVRRHDANSKEAVMGAHHRCLSSKVGSRCCRRTPPIEIVVAKQHTRATRGGSPQRGVLASEGVHLRFREVKALVDETPMVCQAVRPVLVQVRVGVERDGVREQRVR